MTGVAAGGLKWLVATAAGCRAVAQPLRTKAGGVRACDDASRAEVRQQLTCHAPLRRSKNAALGGRPGDAARRGWRAAAAAAKR